MEKQSTSKLLRLMVAVFALFLLVMTGSVLSACGGNVAHEHKYGSPEHTNPSTCGSTGYDVYTCSECGDKYAVVTAATGKHTFTDGICTVCGVSNGDNLKAILDQINSKVGTTTSPENVHKHNFTQEVKKLDPTCLTFGITVMKCDCGSTSVTSLVQATGHKYSKAGETGNRIPSTCTTNGQIEVVCSQCGDTYWEPNKDDMAPGHDFTYRTKEFAEKNDQPANCVSPARIAYKCTRCDEIQYVNVGDTLGGHFYEKDEKGNEVWTKVEGENTERGTTSEEDIDENLKNYVSIGEVLKERACIYCGEKEQKWFPKEHEHNFIHTTSEFNRLTEVTYTVKNEDGTEKTYKETLTKENCTEEGAENWHCVYAGCDALENEAGKWEKVETKKKDEAGKETEEVEVTYEYRPSGWDKDPTKCKEEETVDEVKHTYEWRAKLNHTYADKLKTSDGKYTKESEIEYITEIDKENGKVVTSRGEHETKNNTSSWWGQTCELCGHEIAFQTKDEDGKKVPDVTKEILVIERDEKGEVEFTDNEEWITREWHSWVLYTEKSDTATDTTTASGTGTGTETETTGKKPEKIDPPQTPSGYEKNKAATCTEAGWDWYWCQDSQCKQIPLWVKVILPPLGHDWAIEKLDDPTCEGAGELELKCQRKDCGATLTLTVDNYNDVTDADGWTWNRHTLKTPEWPEATKPEGSEAKAEYADEYVDLWTLGIEASDDDDADNDATPAADAIRRLNKLSWKQKADKESGEGGGDGDEDNKSKEYTLRQALELIIPTGHHWKKIQEVDKKLCYNDKGTSYYCTCEMENCHEEGGATPSTEANKDKVKCTAIWLDVTMTGHLVGEKETEKSFKTFTLYGFCGTNNHGNVENNFCHNTYTVTYCPVCYAIIKVEKSGDNFRHFPFDREKLFGHMMASAPVGKHTLQEVMEDPTLLQEEEGNYADYAAEWNKTQREKFVKTWIEIDSYWFKKEGGTAASHNLIDYIWLRDGDFECFDCYNHVGQFNEIEDLVKNYKTEQIKWSLLYYVKGASGEMILVEESNRYTYNPCEYQYYSQYKIWCETEGKQFTWYSTMRDMTNTEWQKVEGKEEGGDVTIDDVLDAIGKYKLETVKDGKELQPDGKHYLVPANKYWEHENFKLSSDNTVTMDWVCAFCGSTFELEVKYVTPAAGAAQEEPAAYKENVSLVHEDANKILLVDMTGVKFSDTTLNKRNGKDKTPIFQLGDHPIYGKDTKDGKTTVGEGMMAYYANGTVIITELEGSTDICVAHRETNGWTAGGNYFEGGLWKCNDTVLGSKLRPQDFADPNATPEDGKPTLFQTIWAANYSNAGLTDSNDGNGDARKAVAYRLDNLLREGGEIVVGGNLSDQRKMNEKTGSNFKWDTITPAAPAVSSFMPLVGDTPAASIHPLGSLNQKDGGVYSYHVKEDGTDCKGYAEKKCESGDNCSCEGCKVDGTCHCVIVPVLNLDAGTVLDLNGNTLYANIFIGAVGTSGEDVAFGNDGYGHEMTAGEVTVKNGKIVMSPAAKIQVEGAKAHLTLENVEISGAVEGIQAYNGATITIKNSSLITKGFALTSNNCKQTDKGNGTAGDGEANFELYNSAFISTEHTAFFMPAKGNVLAEGCEFYGYDMGVYLRGHDLEEKAAAEGTAATHAKFTDCLFAKGDQSSGAEATSSGTNTKHYGALTIGNDNQNGKSYGSIKDLVLQNCDFEIVKVNKTSESSVGGAWTPGFCEANDGFDLNGEVASPGCDLSSGDGHTKCTEENCCHRAIVINIYGCSKIEGGACMTSDNECNEKCKQDTNGKVTIHMDTATFNHLKEHAQRFSHENTQGESATATLTNPFLGCTFSDSKVLKGQCQKLQIFVDGSEKCFEWLKPDEAKSGS